MTSLQYSISETLENWLAQQGLELTSINTDRFDPTGNLHFAKGSFVACYFDPELDGMGLSLLYQVELALSDPRFENTTLSFPTDTTFKIV